MITLVTLLTKALKKLIQRLLFIIGKGICWVVGFLNEVFEMVAGLKPVTYSAGGSPEKKVLLRVFFGNSNINTIYWGMALIGIVMCFGFTIVAVIRKSADIGDKIKQSLGDILRNCFKSIVIIMLMNFIISTTISITSTLMDRINYLIVNSQSMVMNYDIKFDTDDYATMARALNTIGNYSINSSYNSRYNLNSCYNDIRDELKHMEEKKIFQVTYITNVHENGTIRKVNTWQSVLEAIYRSVDNINVPQPLDEYNTKLSDALLDAMNVIKNDASFAPLEVYHVNQTSSDNPGLGESVALDRMIMLLGSMYGNGSSLTRGSGLTDYLRKPYYFGQKDIFDYSQCDRDFDMSIGSWMYFTVIIVAILYAKEMLAMVFNATARIFNMLLLYITAPPFIAVTPLDDGAKMKQWTTAFLVQSLGLFGTVISLRLVMMFLPVLFSGDIRFFEGARADILTRVIIMYGAIFTARKASGMIVGILADNAGYQAINAGDVGGDAKNAISRGEQVAGGAIGLAGKAIGADIAIGKKIFGSKKNDGGGSANKGGEKGEGDKNGSQNDSESKQSSDNTPVSKLEMGSRSSASETNQNTSVSSVGANGTGTTSRGTFETGGSGSARDFESNRRKAPSLESLDAEGSKAKEAEDISSTNRPNLKQASYHGRGNIEAPQIRGGLHLDPVSPDELNNAAGSKGGKGGQNANGVKGGQANLNNLGNGENNANGVKGGQANLNNLGNGENNANGVKGDQANLNSLDNQNLNDSSIQSASQNRKKPKSLDSFRNKYGF